MLATGSAFCLGSQIYGLIKIKPVNTIQITERKIYQEIKMKPVIKIKEREIKQDLNAAVATARGNFWCAVAHIQSKPEETILANRTIDR
jgi:hypothetical protein